MDIFSFLGCSGWQHYSAYCNSETFSHLRFTECTCHWELLATSVCKLIHPSHPSHKLLILFRYFAWTTAYSLTLLWLPLHMSPLRRSYATKQPVSYPSEPPSSPPDLAVPLVFKLGSQQFSLFASFRLLWAWPTLSTSSPGYSHLRISYEVGSTAGAEEECNCLFRSLPSYLSL